MKEKEKIECLKCIHYYVTWDKRLPHGCKAMNFKSRLKPSLVVMKSAGRDCLLFERKQQLLNR